MRKVRLTIGIAAVALAGLTTSCKKCHECHYDGPDGEVELGEKCGDDLEALEDNGYTVDGTNYTVHCHEH
ncbi:hypothetical protein [Crocinitomix algicola]|uniref:hypothetical protein n=1 Tax=Crocinitomix algicola TaxID=1740263 RepID=UPI000872D2FF|nr:hypothetical protein [Crocinitomix algicola]